MKFGKMMIFLAICCLTSFILIAAASADEISKGNHCYARITPVDEKNDKQSEIIETQCFNSFAEAIFAATNGRVQLDPNIEPDEITDSMLNGNAKNDSSSQDIVIGIDWDYTNYQGGTYTWVVTGTGCTDTTYYEAPSMPASWNDRVSSAIAYSGCKFYHYRDTNFGGTSVLCNETFPAMGTLDNATSSERWVKK